MANNQSISLVGLDFDQIKTNLSDYLGGQSQFNDYDFDGSNISVFVDLLAYNTYMNAFYLNMIASEQFIDSAQLRDSIVSHAKDLNYTPRSFRSAQAVVDIAIDAPLGTASVTMPKGTSFSSRVGANTYTFVTDENIVFTNPTAAGGNTYLEFSQSNVSIFEGQYLTEAYVVVADDTQKFTVNNPTIDTTSMSVSVIENSGANTLSYILATSFLDLDGDSQVYFLQGADDEKYDILFGDDTVGRRPATGAVVVAEYRATSGELPNGANLFRINGDLSGISSSNIAVTTVTSAIGGAISESVESIRFAAPRHFQAQERAVTTTDYESLLKNNFPEVITVAAYGGEEADPPRYGKVFISVDLLNVDGLPDSKRIEYTNFLKPRSPLSIDPVFVDPETMNIRVDSVVNYNVNLTSLSEADLRALVLEAIDDYNTSQLSTFKAQLRYSRLLEAIDEAHDSIVSNETLVYAIKTWEPTVGSLETFSIKFDQALEQLQVATQTQGRHSAETERHTITSTNFVFNGRSVLIEDDGLGKIRLVSVSNGEHVPIQNIGAIDYSTGLLEISNLKVDSIFGNEIKFYARTESLDILANRNVILSILPEDVTITANQIRE